MRVNCRLYSVLIALCLAFSTSAQGDVPALEKLLRNAEPGHMQQVFDQLNAIVAKQPYKEAVLTEDALLHVAAELPNPQEAFNWIYGLTKTTYTDAGQEANLFLYLLSIADDPAFQKPVIRQKIFYEIGFSYYNIGDYGKSQVMLDKFIRNYDGTINRDLINGLTIMGLIYQGRRNFQEALRYYKLALEKATIAKDTVWVGLATGNLGSLYLDMGKLEEGRPLIYQDIATSLNNKLYESAANDYFDLSTIAFGMGKLAWAKTVLDSAIFMLRLNQQPYDKSWARVYKNLARYYAATGHNDSAYHYLLQTQQILDSLQNDRNESVLKLRVNAFSQQKAERDAVMLKASMESSRQNRRFAIIAVLGTLVVACFALLYIRQKMRVNRVLREKATLIEAEKLQEEERRKKEEAANHAKSKLFSLIAHDLRGPIGGLAALLDMMQEGGISPEELIAILPDIKTKVDNLYNVTDNLLRWAYTQMDGRNDQKVTVTVAPVISNVVTLLQDGAAKKDIRICHSAEAGLTVIADPDQLEIVIRNLVSNAVKFSPQGSVVDIEAQLAGNEVVIRVSDNGPGLPQQVYSNLQEGRFSAPATGTAGEKGAGLGLVMCREFVEANDGRIKAEPGPAGYGTVFTITLPSGSPHSSASF